MDKGQQGLPKTANAVQTPLLFLGHHTQGFEGKPVELTGGRLSFEAYLFWAPKIVPNQHQGIMLRVGNASGVLFDRTFMGYQIQEQQRTRQVTAEVFVQEGLDGAINLDRESFNYAHPHYQYIVKWLHSALRQLANRQKELGTQLRAARVTVQGETLRTEVDEKVQLALKARGVDDLPPVVFLDTQMNLEDALRRDEGAIVLQRDVVLPQSGAKHTTDLERQRRQTAERKAMAIAQLLHGWGVLGALSYEDQEKLIRDIVDIMLMEIS